MRRTEIEDAIRSGATLRGRTKDGHDRHLCRAHNIFTDAKGQDWVKVHWAHTDSWDSLRPEELEYVRVS